MVQPLNSVSGQGYEFQVEGDSIDVSAPASNDPVELGRTLDSGKGVIAQAFWPAEQPERADQQVCVTWDSVVDGSTPESSAELLADRTSIHLPGLALRVRPGVDGAGSRAITITQSVHRAQMSLFDVNLVRADVSGTNALGFPAPIEIFDFRDVLGEATGFTESGEGEIQTTLAPPPWHVCAQVVGTTLSMMVWVDGENQPSWDDEDRVQEVKLARHLVYEGYAGAYEQGLSPGYTSTFTGLEVTALY